MHDSPRGLFFDDRGRPDFRERFGALASGASRISSAVGRVRLLGLTLRPEELSGVGEIRLLLQEMNTLAAASEAEQVAADPGRRAGVEHWLHLLRVGRLQLRIAPLAGWSPDFTIFHASGSGPDTLLLGPHWFLRPYPHPGPAFTALFTGHATAVAVRRFDTMWARAHDVRAPIEALLLRALRTSSAPAPPPVPMS